MHVVRFYVQRYLCIEIGQYEVDLVVVPVDHTVPHARGWTEPVLHESIDRV